MDIGKEQETVIVEPIEDPFETPVPDPEPAPKLPAKPEPDREEAPA